MFPVIFAWVLAAICFALPITAQDTTNGNTSTFSAAASIWVSPARDMAFAINVPEDSSSDDIFFTLHMPIHVTWSAVGLGSGSMDNALVLMIYASANGTGVTLSPRLAYGHSEPVYSKEIQVETLPESRLFNKTTYMFNGRCSNCRSWNDGKGRLDVTSRAQKFIYASGPNGDIYSDDTAAPLKRHWNYGNFEVDMVRATGAGGVPVIPTEGTPTLDGTTQVLSKIGTPEKMPIFHAVIMIFCFVGVYPFGILIVRLGSWVRWHAVNQVFALVLFTIGAGLGIKVSYEYNRSKTFNSPHQVIGILIFIFIYAQFALGFVHHRMYKKKTQGQQQTAEPQASTPKPTTKLAPIHMWLGRLTLVLGVVNAFIGFPFALSPHRNYILAGLVIFIFPAVIVIILTKDYIKRQLRRGSKEDRDAHDTGLNLEPWRQMYAEQQNQQQQPVADYGNNNNGTNIPMQQYPLPQNPVVSDVRSYANYHTGPDRRADLGPHQVTRDYV